MDRGAYDAPTTEVQPAIPKLLEVEGLQVGEDRLSLAYWTIHPDNPLTARVAVNRPLANVLWKRPCSNTGRFWKPGESSLASEITGLDESTLY